MKLYKLKTRLIFSIVIGLIGLFIGMIYILIAEVRPFKIIGISNILDALWNTIRLIETFLFFFALSLTLTSILVLITKQKTKRIFISIILGIAIILILAIPEVLIRQKIAFYHKIENKTLDTVQVIELYEKAMKNKDIKAISNIAVHPNLPDSIQEKLSDSEIMEVRRSIAWDTDSEEILRKLSIDKEWEVRMAVAINKTTPIEIFEKLKSDINEDVRNIANSISKSGK